MALLTCYRRKRLPAVGLHWAYRTGEKTIGRAPWHLLKLLLVGRRTRAGRRKIWPPWVP